MNTFNQKTTPEKISILQQNITDILETIAFLDDKINDARNNINENILPGNFKNTDIYKSELKYGYMTPISRHYTFILTRKNKL